jgi:hypothetical protein
MRYVLGVAILVVGCTAPVVSEPPRPGEGWCARTPPLGDLGVACEPEERPSDGDWTLYTGPVGTEPTHWRVLNREVVSASVVNPPDAEELCAAPFECVWWPGPNAADRARVRTECPEFGVCLIEISE